MLHRSSWKDGMTLFIFAVALGVALGYLFHGRLSNLALIHVRWWGLIPVALLLQLGPLPRGGGGTDLLVRTIVLSVSYAMVVVFTLINIRMPGMALISVGVIANFAVIAVNGGMPVSADALRGSGQHDVLTQLRGSAPDQHHLMTDEDSLTFLGDVIAAPPPIARAISIGDIIVCLGLIWFMASSMRGLGARGESRSRAGSVAKLRERRRETTQTSQSSRGRG
jgi:Family of unknown function (DUF5317)